MSNDLVIRLKEWLQRSQPNSTTNDISEIGAACGTAIGQVRKENQDRLLIARISNVNNLATVSVFAMCDGMGGMKNGSECAENTLAVFFDSFINSDQKDIKLRISNAITEANQRIFTQYRRQGGSTLALLCQTRNSLIAATVGDTRIFMLDKNSGFKQVSTDDTIAGVLNRRNGYDFNKSNMGSFVNQLAQFIGIGDELMPRIFDLPLQSNNRYIIASDGAYSIGNNFEKLITSAQDLITAVRRIILVSVWIGGKDNASIIYMQPYFKEYRNISKESRIEFWDPIGQLELGYWNYSNSYNLNAHVFNEKNEIGIKDNIQTQKKSKGKKSSPKNSKSPKSKISRNPLEIAFEKPPEQDRLFSDNNNQITNSNQNSESSLPENKDNADGPEGRNIQNP